MNNFHSLQCQPTPNKVKQEIILEQKRILLIINLLKALDLISQIYPRLDNQALNKALEM